MYLQVHTFIRCKEYNICALLRPLCFLTGGIVNNTLRPTIPTWCDPEWKSLMESCWSADPQQSKSNDMPIRK
ncbi:hypothetical protein HanPI659440_Chr06g0238481 [Helianthus annuus]|nr:hypothetical protein HanPI659440_Chr06g0238481 [Helianthus annuus]